MDRATAVALGKATEAALQAVAAEFGVTVAHKGGKYDPTIGTYTPKVVYSEPDAARYEFARHAASLGLQAEDFGRTFTVPQGTFRIVGVSPRAKKYPVICENVLSGGRYKFPETLVKVRLGLETKEGV